MTPKCHYGSPNHGVRVDVHSWGEDVATAGIGKPTLFDGPGVCFDYSDQFNGSSSASAIIAGAVTALHGIHSNVFGEPFDPLLLRKLLVATGTKQKAGTEDHLIGVHPDLLKVVSEMANW